MKKYIKPTSGKVELYINGLICLSTNDAPAQGGNTKIYSNKKESSNNIWGSDNTWGYALWEDMNNDK